MTERKVWNEVKSFQNMFGHLNLTDVATISPNSCLEIHKIKSIYS